MKSLNYLLIVLAVYGFTSCEEDVISPVADHTTPVVHCLLNVRDSVHYLRLTKTFSGSADARQMAQNPDSVYFIEAHVYFDLWDKHFVFHTIELEPTTALQRDPGIFMTQPFLLYKTDFPLRPGSIRVRIEIPEIETIVIGDLYLIGSPGFTAPDPKQKKVLSFYEDEPVRIIWGGILNVSLTIIRLNYLEVTDSSVDTCHLDWVRKSSNFVIVPEDYLDFIGSWIKDRPEVNYRKITDIDILISTGNEQYRNYQKYHDWSIDILEKPYSNLVNGYGILAGWGNNELMGYLPNQKFIDSLLVYPKTKYLKFVRWLETK